jgi:uncharacterized protein DUF3305
MHGSGKLTSTPVTRIPVGVVVERHKARSSWLDFIYRPVSVLAGVPEAAPGTVVRSEGEVTTFYAGHAVIELHRTETMNYRDNIASGAPQLWVGLRPAEGEMGFDLIFVTADPAEGEALTGAGNDLVEPVAMPAPIIEIVERFIAEHPVEQPFFKRERERAASRPPPARRAGGSKEER